MKSDSFQPFLEFPHLLGDRFELATGSCSAPRRTLVAGGWELRDPVAERWGVNEYQQYIRASKAEFTVAKQGYVVARCGWFSERSAAYLASGRPVITEDTGFSEVLPTGNGIAAFS